MEAPQAELSRSFKRRQRRKKQLERRRQTEGAVGSSDELEPSDAAAPAAASGDVGSTGRKREGVAEISARSPAVNSARAAAEVALGKAGKGRARNSKSEREDGKLDGNAGAGFSSNEIAKLNDKCAEAEASQREDVKSAGIAHQNSDKGASSDAPDRAKSGSAKRRKRKSTGPSAAPSDSQTTDDAAAPLESSGRKGSPSGVAARVSPSVAKPSSEAVATSAASCAAATSASGDPDARSRRRETSPVVSSTEEVLRSIRALQTVLSELRTGLLTAPPPAPTRPDPAPPQTAVQSSGAAMAPPSAAEPAAEPSADAEAQQKTKEQIKAERKAKAEAAKLAKAAKASQKKQQQQQAAAAAAAAAGDGSSGAPAAAGGSVSSKTGSDKQVPPAAQSTAASAVEAKPQKPTAGGSEAAGKPAVGDGEAAGKPATGGGEKSKAELKAERRAKQEAQRAAKAAATAAKAAAAASSAAKAGGQPKTEKDAGAGRQTTPAAKHDKKAAKSDRKSAKKAAEKTTVKKGVQMFSHLLQFDTSGVDALTAKHSVHPALQRLALRLSAGREGGSNAGAVALLVALAELVDDYVTPAQRELRRDLPDQVRRAVAQLAECRPLSVAMENVAARLEKAIQAVPAGDSDFQAKHSVLDWIDNFILDNIGKAMSAITQYAGEKIQDDDVILTYSRSTAVLDVLSTAQQQGRRFRVIVVDSRPRLEGRHMLQQLLDAGVSCSYGLISAISHHMKEATKVLLGAHALLSNGVVLSRAGSALVSLTGRALNRPVLVCCETYKFSERVQTDSQVYNQLGDPDDLVTSPQSPLAGLRQSGSLSLLNLTYDVTPAELVDVVITELGAIPCTSVPAVLRLQQAAAESHY